MAENLELRTATFAKNVRSFCRKLFKDQLLHEDIKQLLRSSGSIGANYIESLENLGIADEKMKLRIVRKEAKESAYWLYLIETNSGEIENERIRLLDESNQLRKIFSSILIKVEQRTTIAKKTSK